MLNLLSPVSGRRKLDFIGGESRERNCGKEWARFEMV